MDEILPFKVLGLRRGVIVGRWDTSWIHSRWITSSIYVLEDIRPGCTSYKQSGTKKGVVENIYPPDTSCASLYGHVDLSPWGVKFGGNLLLPYFSLNHYILCVYFT